MNDQEKLIKRLGELHEQAKAGEITNIVYCLSNGKSTYLPGWAGSGTYVESLGMIELTKLTLTKTSPQEKM